MRLFCAMLIMAAVVGCGPIPAGEPNSKLIITPTSIGKALPTPAIPLSQVKGLLGDTPKNDAETLKIYAQSFANLVFKTEWGGPNEYIRKWNESPVYYRFDDDIQNDQKAAARKAFNMVSELIGIEIEKADRIKGHIRIATGAEWEIRAGCAGTFDEIGESHRIKGKIFYQFYPKGFVSDGTIRYGMMIWGREAVEYGAPLDVCAIEELSQMFGILAESELVKYSKWRDKPADKAKSLTVHDGIILRTLYDNRIKPGMHKDQAMPIVRMIIKELLEELNK